MIAPLPVATSDLAMVTLLGRPYVLGGMSDRVYTLDMTNTNWTTRTPMPKALYYHRAIVFDTDTALVCVCSA